MLSFDPTVSLGALLNAGVLVVGFTVAFTRLGGRIDLLSQRVGAVEEYMRQARDFSSRIAVMETRQATHGQMIANTQQDLRELKHGDGFVMRPPAT